MSSIELCRIISTLIRIINNTTASTSKCCQDIYYRHYYQLIAGFRMAFLLGCRLLNTILMLNIEDLIPQIVSSPLFQQEVRRQIQLAQSQEPSSQPPKEVALPSLLQEINCYLCEITQLALEEENSRNYRSFMQKNQQLWMQLEHRTNLAIEQASQELTAKLECVQLSLSEKIKGAGRPAETSGRLKEERRALTRNILQNSYLQNLDCTKSTFTIKSGNQESLYSLEELASDKSGIGSSLASVGENHRLLQIQRQCRSQVKSWSAGFERALEGLRQHIESLEKAQSSAHEQVQQKLQGNLESVWNVISDLCSRLGKLEALLPFEEISP